jgi:hypothetical protein
VRGAFDGWGARAGEHLTYQRGDNRLHSVGDLLHQGKAAGIEWQMMRAGE